MYFACCTVEVFLCLIGRVIGGAIPVAVHWGCCCNDSRVVGSFRLGLFVNYGCSSRVMGGGKLGSSWGGASMWVRVMSNWYTLGGVVMVTFD